MILCEALDAIPKQVSSRFGSARSRAGQACFLIYPLSTLAPNLRSQLCQYGNELIAAFNAGCLLPKCQTLICAAANIDHMRFAAMGPCNRVSRVANLNCDATMRDQSAADA